MRWLHFAAAAACLVLGACAGHGPRIAFAPAEAPYVETLGDARWQASAAAARRTLIEARAHHRLPALSVAVVIEGRLAWAAASGWADVARGVPAGLDTRYRIGSTSKAVTATALARLVDQGRMNLDAPIATWRGDLPNPAWNRLTPRQLASHMAGIIDYGQNRDLAGLFHSLRERRQFASVAAALGVFDGNALAYPPGTAFRYTSFDTVLLSAAIEGAAGKPFLAVLADEIARPLAAASLSADHQDRAIPDRAVFYHRDDKGLKRWRRVNHSYKWAGGGLIASSRDLARIGAAWLDPAFITPATRTAFWQPQRLASGEINPQSYAIGWRSNRNNGLFGPDRPVWNVHHGGVSKGAYSWLVIYPDYGVVVALNTNARLGDFQTFMAIEQAITRRFLEGRPAAPISFAAAPAQ